MAAADRVAGHRGDDGLGQGADLALQVEHVQARDAVFSDIASLAAHALVSAGAEGVGALAGQDDDADLLVVARVLEGPAHLFDGERPEGVAHLGAVDRDAGDALLALLVLDVFETGQQTPVGQAHERLQ